MTLYTMADPSLLQAPPVDFNDFMQSLTKTKPTVAIEDLRKYEEWTVDFG